MMVELKLREVVGSALPTLIAERWAEIAITPLSISTSTHDVLAIPSFFLSDPSYHGWDTLTYNEYTVSTSPYLLARSCPRHRLKVVTRIGFTPNLQMSIQASTIFLGKVSAF
jgi:hypothetical protein